MRSFLSGALVAGFMLLSFAAAADGPVAAGNVTLLTGTATAASTNGWQRALARGAPVYSGDVVETGPSSYAQLKFSDAGAILLRPGTQFRIDSYHYAAAAPAAQPVPQAAPEAATGPTGPPVPAVTETLADSTFFTLLKGGLRGISGLVGQHDHSHYRLDSAVATMGIRGTEFVYILCDDVCATDPGFAQSLPAGVSAKGGLITGVEKGEIVVTSTTGKTMTLSVTQYGITLPNGDQYLLKVIPTVVNNGSSAGPGNTGGGLHTGTAAGRVTANGFAQGAVIAGTVLVGVGAAVAAAALSSGGNSGTTSTTSTH